MSAQPMRSICARYSSSPSSMRKPGIVSSLSTVPPVCPRPRPLIIGTGTPSAATSGASTSETLSPTPPVECLSTFTPGTAERSTTTPERSITSTSAASSSSFSPTKKTAIRKAAIWYSSTLPCAYASRKLRSSSGARLPPSRLRRITSYGVIARPVAPCPDPFVPRCSARAFPVVGLGERCRLAAGDAPPDREDLAHPVVDAAQRAAQPLQPLRSFLRRHHQRIVQMMCEVLRVERVHFDGTVQLLRGARELRE